MLFENPVNNPEMSAPLSNPLPRGESGLCLVTWCQSQSFFALREKVTRGRKGGDCSASVPWLACRVSVCVAALSIWLSVAGQPQATAGDRSGSIRGLIAEKSPMPARVTAIDRKSQKRFAGTIDLETRSFQISNLPVDARYDCVLDFMNGVRLEGVNLNVPPSDYVEEQPLSEEDVETIRGKVKRMNRFEDVVEIRTIQGNIQHAAILINKLRTKPFFDSKPGEVIWRAELWHFERPEETWVKVQDELFIVLYRERIQHSEFRKKSLTFDASLGGLKPTAEQPIVELRPISVPEKKPGIHFRDRNSGAKKQPDT